MSEKLKVGAVIYAPQVTVIWGIIADFCAENGCPIEPVYFKDYKSQVDALVADEIDVAWNSPLAWLDTYLRTQGKALNGAMRDTDRDRQSYLVVNKNIIRQLADLKDKTIGFGAIDSPQARLIPIQFLAQNGLAFEQGYVEKRFDIGVGLHGDHVGGELDAAKALTKGEVVASWMLDFNFEKWTKDGTLDPATYVVLAKTPPFDHCIFSGRPTLAAERFAQFTETLFKMDYNNPLHKEMMDLEGLTAWVEGRTSGFAQLIAANQYINFF